ncbi:CLUMA_CG004540, isoform A [Clunio marinus]|uniref:CLUMA_CG004540, isoform A n=1 Tax=Clunio marinus TaxID=568069 RepID=A0A1J1HTG3_9DIPT|nr:CLUMA_CG004540, isoform A [Clunio marinus]
MLLPGKQQKQPTEQEDCDFYRKLQMLWLAFDMIRSSCAVFLSPLFSKFHVRHSFYNNNTIQWFLIHLVLDHVIKQQSNGENYTEEQKLIK